jgi:hypothetical protein
MEEEKKRKGERKRKKRKNKKGKKEKVKRKYREGYFRYFTTSFNPTSKAVLPKFFQNRFFFEKNCSTG